MCMMWAYMLQQMMSGHLVHMWRGWKHNNGIIIVSGCDYFNHNQSSHLDGESGVEWISIQKLFPRGNWCGCWDVESPWEKSEVITLLQLERRKYIWLARVSVVPGEEDLDKSRKWFSDRKWSAKQVGRRYRLVWRWARVIYQPVYRRHGHLINQHSCIIMPFLNIWQSVTPTLCVHN